MDMLRQIASLQTPSPLFERQPRTLPRDRASAVRDQRERLGSAEAVVVLPYPVVVRIPVSEQCSQRSGQRVSLTTGTLKTALAVRDEGVLAVRDVVASALLDDGHAAESVRQFLAERGRVFGTDVDVLGFG